MERPKRTKIVSLTILYIFLWMFPAGYLISDGSMRWIASIFKQFLGDSMLLLLPAITLFSVVAVSILIFYASIVTEIYQRTCGFVERKNSIIGEVLSFYKALIH